MFTCLNLYRKEILTLEIGDMKDLKFLVCIALLWVGATVSSLAQDRIHMANGTIVEAKVIEIGSLEIKYKFFGEEDGPVYGVEKDLVRKIVFASGREETYGALPMDAETYFAGQKRSAIKMNFLGPLIGHTTLFFEQSIKPGQTWQIRASMIGLGRDLGDEARGFIAGGGMRFMSKPSYYTANMRRSHLLQGWYANPEAFVGFNSFLSDEWYNGGNFQREREEHIVGGILLNLGKQWVLGERFVIDLGFGLGYGFGESRRVIYVGDITGFAATSYLNIGFTL